MPLDDGWSGEEAASDHLNEPSALHHWVFPQVVWESGARGCGASGNRAGSMQEPSLQAGRSLAECDPVRRALELLKHPDTAVDPMSPPYPDVRVTTPLGRIAVWDSAERCVEAVGRTVAHDTRLLIFNPVFDEPEQLDRVAPEQVPTLASA